MGSELTFFKVIAVAVAIGLDVLAISIGVGIMQIGRRSSVRLGISFTVAEIIMQVIGYELGTGAGVLFGQIAAWIGLVLLAAVGVFMIRESYRHRERAFDPTRGAGLLVASLSISLDSLGVGFALPAVGISLIPLLITISITTGVFTAVGLAFGAKIGERYEHRAERAAGAMLVLLAILFSLQRILGYAT
jgi:putative Mn2+ efflux pump MntP